MNEQTQRLRIGILVLGAMILFGVLVLVFGGYPNLFKAQTAYTVVFTSAPGVAEGTPVRRSGVRIGQVSHVALDDITGKVNIVVLIDRGHSLFTSDVPRLTRGLLSGDTAIDFVPQFEAGKELVLATPADVFTGDTSADVGALLNQTTKMVPTVEEALNDIRKTLQRYEKLAPQLEDTMKSIRDTSGDIRALARKYQDIDVNKTNQDLQATLDTWRRLGERSDLLIQRTDSLLEQNQDKLTKTIERLSSIAKDVSDVTPTLTRNVDKTMANIADRSESIVKNTDRLLKESRDVMERMTTTLDKTQPVLENLKQATKPFADHGDEIVKNLDKAMFDLRGLLQAINQSDGTVRRLISDPALYTNLNDIAFGVTRLMCRMDRILADVEVFADKIARHPEALGVRGAIKPSSGLKDSPFYNSNPQNGLDH
jgi:phospholipid/cholesterol/gamma-HCH transport system substrate-binding protein